MIAVLTTLRFRLDSGAKLNAFAGEFFKVFIVVFFICKYKSRTHIGHCYLINELHIRTAARRLCEFPHGAAWLVLSAELLPLLPCTLVPRLLLVVHRAAPAPDSRQLS